MVQVVIVRNMSARVYKLLLFYLNIHQDNDALNILDFLRYQLVGSV